MASRPARPSVPPPVETPLSPTGRRFAAALGRCDAFWALRRRLIEGVRDSRITVDEVPALADAVGRAAGVRPSGDYVQNALACRRDTTTHVLTTLAILFAVPLETWGAWMRRAPNRDMDLVVGTWTWTWEDLPARAWTPARRAQAADFLSALPPRLSPRVQQRVAKAWRAGTGPMAVRLEHHLPDGVFAALKDAAAYDLTPTVAAAGATGRADVAPIRDLTEIARLTEQVEWGRSTPADRVAVLRRCRFDQATPDQARALRGLVYQAVMAVDAGQMPAVRAVVRTQGTLAARAEVLTLLQGFARVADVLGRDPVLLTEIADEVAATPAAARADVMATLVLAGWSVLDPTRWSQAVAQIVRQQRGRRASALEQATVRSALQCWWAALEDPAVQVAPELVTECLAGPDRELAAWALLQLVPRVAAPSSPTPPPTPVARPTRRPRR